MMSWRSAGTDTCHVVVTAWSVDGVRSIAPGGISHIQYADDTVIMIDCSEKSVWNLKLILYCFEWLFGLKINFHKSDVFVFGVDQGSQETLANMLNCRLEE